MTDRTDIAALIDQCSSSDADARSSAARALGEAEAEHAAVAGPALTTLLCDADDSVRNEAAEALGLLRYQPAREELERVLKCDGDWIVRASAAEALGELADPQALDTLIAALADDARPVRSYAALAIGLMGESARLPAVRARLDVEAAVGTRAELIAAAMRLGDATVLDNLLTLTDDADPDALPCVLETVEDLLTRKTPTILIARAPEVSAWLAALGLRTPIISRHAAALSARLAALVGG
ncbi:HEAT repeat domain-containing protein [Haliangium sp.]|uniref:HEAT repeat domain-containing protein n=1 Tax=Haliangium sp. TaxID=2663208 RepID=UPI003D10EB49